MTTPAMKMPELLIFARWVVLGFVGAEVCRTTFYLSEKFALSLTKFTPCVPVGGIVFVALICFIYALKRGAIASALQIVRSLRVDLFVAIAVGIFANDLALPWLARTHAALKNTNPDWAPAVLALLCTVLLSQLVQLLVKHIKSKRKKSISQLYFIADEEIRDEKDDLLTSEEQVRSFADSVLACGTQSGLIFGVDGPWGVGKTSFINLVVDHWKTAQPKPIVCRFEPLCYASEIDLTDRLIRDLSAAIQSEVFAPEFRPVVSRYSRLIKGKTDFSFLGFKLSLEPSQETVDELLDDIDEVLRRLGRKVIIVIDDLDRLDPKTTNNVLFATRRTFNLSQATYVLCYDTEILAESKDEGSRAREFLEKFVSAKLSLFIDSSHIRDFLKKDWQNATKKLDSIPADTMFRLGGILNELATILDSDLAPNYLPLVGNLRKVKRFINTLLLMQLEKCDLDRTDFNNRDLINLILLHLNYPGLFRRIYAEETEGRSGIFSVKQEFGKTEFINLDALSPVMDENKGNAGFLLAQLFEVNTLGLNGTYHSFDDMFWSSRACFNSDSYRNLEKYLKRIVRFVTPEPQDTFVLYQEAVKRVTQGASIDGVLESPAFKLEERGECVHDKFWAVLVNHSHELTQEVAEDAITTLINYLPRYSSIKSDVLALRQRSIYSLLLLLDRAGWGRVSATRGRVAKSTDGIITIAQRIFGEPPYEEKGLLKRLADEARGVLGWKDLMMFRLQCSADRSGQLHNLHSALITHQDRNAATFGNVNNLALTGMRKLSQEIFALFKRIHIDSKRNFFSDANDTEDEVFLSKALSQPDLHTSNVDQPQDDTYSMTQRIDAARSMVKSFVIYQLSNQLPPTGSGVGCGYYDEIGIADGRGIAKLMNEYVFGFCFNPEVDEKNLDHFLDHCLLHLSNAFFSGGDEPGYFATKAELPGGLDPKEMGRYWGKHNDRIRKHAKDFEERCVSTSNYIASYRDHLSGVFDVLDTLASEAIAATE